MNRSRTTLDLPGLLVLVGAGAVLVGCSLFPWYNGAEEQDRRARCRWKLRQIGLALLQYSQDNNEGFPNDGGGYSTDSTAGPPAAASGASVLGVLLYDQYCPDPEVFACPTTPPVVSWSIPPDTTMISYGYDQRHTSTHPADVALCSDQPPWSGGPNSQNHYGDGQNVLFIDGHVEWCTTTNAGHSDGTARDDIFTADAYPDQRCDSWIVP